MFVITEDHRKFQRKNDNSAEWIPRIISFLKIRTREVLVVAPALLDASLDSFFVLPPVLLEELRGHRIRGRIRVRVAQQRLNGGQNSSDIVSWAPPRIEMLLKIWVSNEKCDGATPGCSA